jgi:hypothetical protein
VDDPAGHEDDTLDDVGDVVPDPFHRDDDPLFPTRTAR